jgi:phosphate-selective porin OprO and OprP
LRSHPIKLKALLLASVFAGSLAGFAAQAQEAAPAPLTADQRIERLEQELETLKRQRELDQELDTAAAEKNPVVVIDKKGLKVTSVDKKYEFSLTGAYQFDHRQYLDDDGKRGQDGFISRRLRPTFQLKAGNASFRLTPDFGGSTVRLFDAYGV